MTNDRYNRLMKRIHDVRNKFSSTSEDPEKAFHVGEFKAISALCLTVLHASIAWERGDKDAEAVLDRVCEWMGVA